MMILANPQLLMLSNDNGTTVAHVLAQYQPSATKKLLAMPKVLLYVDLEGRYVAHNIAMHKRSKIKELYEMKDVLALADRTGWKVEDELNFCEKRRKQLRLHKDPLREAIRRHS